MFPIPDTEYGIRNVKITGSKCKAWIADLRSGQYNQGKGALYSAVRHEYCSIGSALPVQQA